MNRYLPRDTSLQLLKKIRSSSLPYTYDQEKHRIIILDESGNEQVHFRLPIVLPPPTDSPYPENKEVNYVILLIQSGNCSLGYFEDGINLDHKVYRSYMVRKKQGKSQIKYLKTKGKSRAGSRVRLGEAIEFFENINGRLREYFQDHEIHRIAISCSKTLIPYLFNSNIAIPFDKHDPRLFKIPRHVHTPIYEVMLDINKFLIKGELIYENHHQAIVDELLGEVVAEHEIYDEYAAYDADEDDLDIEED